MSLANSAGEVNFFDGKVTLAHGAPPQGDCLFVATDMKGALDERAHRIMEAAGLATPITPNPYELERGYAVYTHSAGILVFIVVPGRPANGDFSEISKNLTAAFRDDVLLTAKEIWIPALADPALVLGTTFLLVAIQDSGWLSRSAGHVTLEILDPVSVAEINALINSMTSDNATTSSLDIEASEHRATDTSNWQSIAQDLPPLQGNPSASASAPQQREVRSAESSLDNAFRNRTLKFGEDLNLLLRRAIAFLRSQRKEGKRKMRAFELLFIAAAGGAPLKNDWSYESAPLQRLAAALFGSLEGESVAAFAKAFRDFKGNGAALTADLPKDVAGLRGGQLLSVMLEECNVWLRHAADIATAAGRSEVNVGDFVDALWLTQNGSHVDLLSRAGISLDRLKHAYERVGSPPEPPLIAQDAGLHQVIEKLADAYVAARVQQIRRHLEHDLAAEEDRINYEPYADAFAAFLTDEATSGPISISIQAPWGAGKSSLMQMIRNKIDVGWKAERPRQGATIGKVLAVLDNVEYRTARIVHAIPRAEAGKPTYPQRLTVWFNAWKYENVEQVWAGLVDAIITQVGERLDPVERELFLLRLNMARIDDGLIRKKIHARIFSYWVAGVGKIAGALVAFGLAALGIGSALGGTSSEHVELLANLKHGLLAGAGASQLGLIAYLWHKFTEKQEKVKEEPATYSLAEYIRAPDYDKSAGVIHQIHQDLRRVLDVLPERRRNDKKVAEPIVIFIDDLDRCSPTKVASVVEGVNAFLASNLCECLFVIGMDPQMVAAALEYAHKDIKGQLPSYDQNVPMGWRYMDKFVQLPFTIPPAKKEHYRGFVDKLISIGSAAPAGAEVKQEAQPSTTAPSPAAQAAEAQPPAIGPAPAARTPVPFEAEEAMRTSPAPAPAAEPAAPVVKAAQPRSTTQTQEKESRDTGILLGTILDHYQCSPREIKRYINFIRLILILRRARQEKAERVPGISQYASWVVICLRWPDMARWLMWGSESLPEEARTPACNALAGLMARRLHVMEEAARQQPDDWAKQAAKWLGLPDTGVPWLQDRDVREFFIKEGTPTSGLPVSQGASVGFY